MKKASVQVGRPSLLRHTNALILLSLLREAGSCSRADLVRASGLSAPTVTNVVSDLLAANLIKPLGEGESSGGRPPDMISFKAERGCLLAVEIKAAFVAFLLTDLRGTELDTARVELANRNTTPEAICLLIRDAMRSLLKRQKTPREQLLAVVVGVPAITDVDKGVVISISTLENWRSVPLRSMLCKLMGLNDCFILIENDTNLAALGERLRGAAKSEETFVSICIDTNVSAGIVLGGQLHHGAQWSAGEIAYLRLPHVSRKYPTLHEFGELEGILTSSGIVESWQKEAARSSGGKRTGKKQTTALEVLELAQGGDAVARRILQQRAAIVSDIVLNLSLILNPDLILLGGDVGSHPVLLSLVRKQLEKSEFAVTRIASAALGNTATLWGAIAVALDRIPTLLLPSPAA